MNLTIKRITSKNIETKYGPKVKYTISVEKGHNGTPNQMYDSWVADFNRDWKEGQTIEIKDSQIVPRDYNGKTYFTIAGVPKQETALSQMALQVINDKLETIVVQNNRILEEIKRALENRSKDSDYPPMPEPEEVDVDSIPF